MPRSRSRRRSRSRSKSRSRSRGAAKGRDAARLYVGNISSKTSRGDLEHEAEKFGRIRSCTLMNGYAFLEFEDALDADDCVRSMDGLELDGRRISVEKSRARGDRGYSRREEPEGSGRKGGAVRGNRDNCLTVEGLGSRTTWKDLKDFARTAGNVEYTDIWYEGSKKLGVIKYTNRSDYKNALKKLDDTRCDGEYVRVFADSGSPSRSRSRSRSRKRSRSRSPKRGRSEERSKKEDK